MMNTVLAILLDIEGTTTSISFVHDVLFPYAKKHVGDYVRSHEAEVQDVLQQIREIVGDVDLDGAIAALQQWMEQDKKITPLKTLQGMMWEDGYKSGAFQGHLYKDAYDAMVSWKKQGIPLYIYSSGSVQAQKLLFRYSCYGDLTYLFSGHFDTKVGDKKEQSSYEKIAGEIGLPADSILFLSDVVEELDAAKKAGMQTTLLARGNLHTTVHSFEQIDLPSTPVDEIIRAGQFLDKMGLCPATGGNISVRAGELVAITVSGKDKGELTPQDVLYVDFSGKAFNSAKKPSAETLLHTVIYSTLKSAGAVIHHHTIPGAVLSKMEDLFQTEGYEMHKALGLSTHESRVEMPIFENSQDYPALAAKIGEYLRQHPEIYGFFLRGHGPYIWGRDMREARIRVETFEYLFQAEMQLLTRASNR